MGREILLSSGFSLILGNYQLECIMCASSKPISMYWKMTSEKR